MFGLAAGGAVALLRVTEGGLPLYGTVALGYLAIKLVLALCYRPARGQGAAGARVAAVVPFYNEDPETLVACLRSILDQSHPIDQLLVVDDGSDDRAAHAAAVAVVRDAGHPAAVVHRLPANEGKRRAQAWAFERLRGDIVLTVDSDTVLERDALHEGLRAFSGPSVQAVTGNVQARNAHTNLLTRLTALRYANAFLWERAAYSAVGSVLCACGSFSLWRRSLIEDHLADYIGQSFLGMPALYGDDRRLTNYALARGKVVLQDTAIAHTSVPDRFGHYASQQLRWSKSFFRETLWVLRTFRPWRRAWLFSVAEIALWLGITLALVHALVVHPLVTGGLPSAWYAVFVAVMAYARSVRYLGSQPTRLRSQVVVYLAAPLYGLLYLVVLMPIRLWALCSLRNPGWGTRARVEVRWTPEPAERSPRLAGRTSARVAALLQPTGEPECAPAGAVGPRVAVMLAEGPHVS